MKKCFLIFAMIILSFSISSENANAWTGGVCAPLCDASIWAPPYDANCINVRSAAVSCHPGLYGCEYEFKAAGSWCLTGTCCSGSCGADPRTDTQCQDATCGGSGWTASNKPDGTVCTKNGKSSTCMTGVCQTPLCTPCDGGATLCGYCSDANPGKRCDLGGSGLLLVDPTCSSPCAASSTYVTSPTCSGAVSGTGANCGYYWCASPSTPSNTCVQSPANCASTGCASRTPATCGNTDCKLCASTMSCIDYNADCPLADNCNTQTSEAACNAQSGGSSSYACGWCPNSYNGGTSPNGGTCMKATDLAANCVGSCYITGDYTLPHTYSYCNGVCPTTAGTYGYYAGFCLSAYSNTGSVGCGGASVDGQTCNCRGNKFNTAKSSDNTVNCGECNINANGQNCGGTAVTTPNEGANVYGGAHAAKGKSVMAA